MDSIKIAIADDQQLFRKGLSSILKDFSHFELIIEAENGKDLLNRLDENIPDVILMDLKMPVLNGLETSKQVMVKYPQVKIIILSTHGDEDFIIRTMQVGVHGYLVKDTDPLELKKAIENVVTDGIYLNKHVSTIILQQLKTKSAQGQKLNDRTLGLQLTSREMEILTLICKGMTTAEIAEKLFISVNTVEGHRKNLFEKTGARNAVSLAVYSLQNALVVLD